MDYLTGITGRQVLGSLLFVCLFSCCFVFSAAGADEISCDLSYSQFSDGLADNGDPSCGSPEFLTPAVSASEPTHEICVEFAKGNLGYWNGLYLRGYVIKDCDGYNHYEWFDDDTNVDPSDYVWSWRHHCKKKIDLSKTFLNCEKPFERVVLYFTLKRQWYIAGMCCRYDGIVLNVSDYITSTKKGENTFSFEARQDYGWLEADEVDIFDLQGNRLLHYPKTRDEGHYN